MSEPTPSTACWSSDARITSAPLDPGRGRGQCASDPDPCNTVSGATGSWCGEPGRACQGSQRTGHPDSTRRHEVDPSSGLPRVGPARSYEAVPRCAEAGSAGADPTPPKPPAGPVPRSGWKSESGPIDVDAIMSGV